MGIRAVDTGLVIQKQTENDSVVALAGNPNVGKSTVFNALTNLNQHTGNWPGKTVTNAQGYHKTKRHSYVLVDLPGTYSLMAHSAEEEVARDFVCFGGAEAVIVVCDATCLERNLNLVLQTMEISDKVLVCVNLMDEARRKHIAVDLQKLSEKLGVPVVGTEARKKKSLTALTAALDDVIDGMPQKAAYRVTYPGVIEEAVSILLPSVTKKVTDRIDPRWLSLKLLDYDDALIKALNAYLGFDILEDEVVRKALNQAKSFLSDLGITQDGLEDRIVSSLVKAAEEVCRDTVRFEKNHYNVTDRKIDRILTSRFTGYPVMLALLAVIFWLTITGANYPSQWLSDALFWVQDRLTDAFHAMHAPEWLHGMLVLGVYHVLAWVVSVMLPPMAIFFPLFTLLEDAGYLPRVAYNLDRPFKRCHACGKQALTMCMGFGCNAAGIVGCRIIDSPRERLIAMLTNNFVPCNGRFAQPHKGKQSYCRVLTRRKKQLNSLYLCVTLMTTRRKSKHIVKKQTDTGRAGRDYGCKAFHFTKLGAKQNRHIQYGGCTNTYLMTPLISPDFRASMILFITAIFCSVDRFDCLSFRSIISA